MNTLKTITAAFVMFVPMLLHADVMLWGVDPSTIVIDNSSGSVAEWPTIGQLQDVLNDETATWNQSGHTLNAIVYVKDKQGNVLRTLQNRIGNDDSDAYTKAIDVGSVKSGVAVDNVESEGLNSLMREYYYQVQIVDGRQNPWDPNSTTYSTILYSDNVSGAWLNGNGHYYLGEGIDEHDLTQWSPEQFYTENPGLTDWETGPRPFHAHATLGTATLPESSTGLLMIVGASLLLLRRKHLLGEL